LTSGDLRARFQIENAGEPDLTIKLAAVLALAAIGLAGLGLPQLTPPALWSASSGASGGQSRSAGRIALCAEAARGPLARVLLREAN
jgi:hypothetical protein